MGKGSAGREARRARQEEEQREERVKTGTESIRRMFASKFNKDFYDADQAAQVGAYTKEFDKQWETARKSLEAALLRTGLYDSTEGTERMRLAREERADRLEDINQRAYATVQGHKQNVIAAEDNVLGQLRSSGDLNASNAAAAQQMAFQSQPTPFSPLGAVFTDFTAGLAEQGNQERQGTNRYNLGVSGMFNNSRNRYTQTVRGG